MVGVWEGLNLGSIPNFFLCFGMHPKIIDVYPKPIPKGGVVQFCLLSGVKSPRHTHWMRENKKIYPTGFSQSKGSSVCYCPRQRTFVKGKVDSLPLSSHAFKWKAFVPKLKKDTFAPWIIEQSIINESTLKLKSVQNLNYRHPKFSVNTLVMCLMIERGVGHPVAHIYHEIPIS